MRILYYNLQLGSFDGSSAHAAWMLAALRGVCGPENVLVANRPESRSYSHTKDLVKAKLGPAADVPRMLRKRAYSERAASEIVARVRESGFEPDVLLARSTLYDYAPVKIAGALGCKLVTEANTPLEYECCDLRHVSLRPLVRSFERGLYGASDGIYAVSETLKDMLVSGYGIPAGKVKVVPNGYSADLYSDFAEREAVRRRVRGEEGVEGAFVVVFLGSLQIWHGIERLIDVVRMLHSSSDAGRIVFWVMGDGPKRELVEFQSKNDPDFIWFGNVDSARMKELLYAADLGVMPYNRIEKFYFSPLKMYDMIGAGLPYIGLRIGQIEEETPEPAAGICLLDSVDPGAYSEMICALAHEDNVLETLRKEFSTLRSEASWDRRAQELVNWLYSITLDR